MASSLVGRAVVAGGSSILTESLSSGGSSYVGSNLINALSPASPSSLEGWGGRFGQVCDISESDCATEGFARENGLVMEADNYMNVRMHTTPERLGMKVDGDKAPWFLGNGNGKPTN